MKKDRKQHEILVLGGGASGMMAAITAARMGADIAILEHKDKVGKKILATGNGRCNLTNSCQEKWCYRSDNPSFPFSALQIFSQKDTRDFFENLGILLKERNGYWYPYSGQASTILDGLRMELKRLSIPIYYEIEIEKIEIKKEKVLCYTKDTILETKNLILATGSKASPKTGSDGSGYLLAKQLGHTIIPPVPALVPLIAEENYFKSIAGVRTEATVTLWINNKEIVSDTGELQIVEYGLSGIPIFQISRFAAKALEETKRLSKKNLIEVKIDFFPKWKILELHTCLQKQLSLGNREKTLEEILEGFFHKKLAILCIKQAKLSLAQTTLNKKEEDRLLVLLKEFPVKIKETKSFEQAQICAGGISTKEIYADSMRSKLYPNLYFAGELIDVDGACGGYNLQWAWTSGYLAGKSAAENRKAC